MQLQVFCLDGFNPRVLGRGLPRTISLSHRKTIGFMCPSSKRVDLTDCVAKAMSGY